MSVYTRRVQLGSITALACAATALAQVTPSPKCFVQIWYPDAVGACGARPSNTSGCQDSISGEQDPCSYTKEVDSGLSERNGYDRSCTYRPGVLLNDGTCGLGPFTTITVRCYEAVGESCGDGCGAC